MKKLIFIEGVSGVGKSTTAQKLCEALNSLGLKTACYLEGDTDNPVDFYNCAYLTKAELYQLLLKYPNDVQAIYKQCIQEQDYVLVRYGGSNTAYFETPLINELKAHEAFYKPAKTGTGSTPVTLSIERYTQLFTDSWRRFLRGDSYNTEYAIFDGSLIYHRANDLIHNNSASDEEIAAHISDLLSVMIPQHQPLLFYLSSDNVGERLVQARKSRGQAAADEARIASETERKNRQLRILRLLPIQAHVFDISDGWDSAIDEMINIVMEDG